MRFEIGGASWEELLSKNCHILISCLLCFYQTGLCEICALPLNKIHVNASLLLQSVTYFCQSVFLKSVFLWYTSPMVIAHLLQPCTVDSRDNPQNVCTLGQSYHCSNPLLLYCNDLRPFFGHSGYGGQKYTGKMIKKIYNKTFFSPQCIAFCLSVRLSVTRK